jgi:hypothetical protein
MVALLMFGATDRSDAAGVVAEAVKLASLWGTSGSAYPRFFVVRD